MESRRIPLWASTRIYETARIIRIQFVLTDGQCHLAISVADSDELLKVEDPTLQQAAASRGGGRP